MPYRLRYMLAWDHKLCRAVLGFLRRQARKSGVLERARRGYHCNSAIRQRNVLFHAVLSMSLAT